MKYCLSVNKDTKVDGYTTVVLQPRLGIESVNSKIEDASATELLAEEVLCFFEFEKQVPVLHTLAKKIRRGGTLVVGCTDIDVLLDDLDDESDLNTINRMFYGVGEPVVKSAWDVTPLKEELSKLGFQIVNQRFDDHRAIIKAVRP